MFDNTLGTTNLLLGILALVSLLEAVLLVVAGVVGLRLYRRSCVLLDDIEKQLPPLIRRVDALTKAVEDTLTDVRGVTSRAARGAEATELAIQAASGLASLATHSAQLSLASRAFRLWGLARGVRAAYKSFVGGAARAA
jgi:hypothetical protein